LLYILKINFSKFLHICIYIDWHIYFPEILFPIIFHYFSLPPHIWVCVRVRLLEVLLPLISHYFIADIFVMDGIFAFLRSYLSLSSLDFPCYPLSIHIYIYIGWFVHFPEVLFFFFSLYMGIYFGYNDRFPEALLLFIPYNYPLFSIFFPYAYYVLDGMSIFPRPYFPLLFSRIYICIG